MERPVQDRGRALLWHGDERHVPAGAGRCVVEGEPLRPPERRGLLGALGGTYGNWAVTLLAASLGTAAMTPIASAGFGAQRWQEGLVTFGFVAIGISILVASGLLLFGFRRAPEPRDAASQAHQLGTPVE